MKITDIKSYPVWVGSRNQMVVKVETDEGIYGLGEAGLSGRELAVQGRSSTTASSSSAGTRCNAARCGRRCTAASISRAGAS